MDQMQIREFASLSPDDPVSQVSTSPNERLSLQQQQRQDEGSRFRQQEPLRGRLVLMLSHVTSHDFDMLCQQVFVGALVKLLAPRHKVAERERERAYE